MKLFKQITANNIELKPYPFKKELAMEAYLIENEEILSLDDENFTDVIVLDAEIALKKGRRDRDGRIDILSSYGGEYLSIVELKLNEINQESLIQLESYLDQREQILEFGEYWKEESAPKWIGILVGNSISAELQEKLTNGYKYLDIPIAAMTLNRYRSPDSNIFVVSDTYFKYNYTQKDYSKFVYKEEEYNKRRLVNVVVKDFVEDNPTITFAQLRERFPKYLQGSFGVFDKLSTAEEIYEKWDRKRHYIKPSETINLMGEVTIATCTQWGVDNISKFIKNANKLGYIIKIK